MTREVDPLLTTLFFSVLSIVPATSVPTVSLTADDLNITQSCTIAISPGTTIEDTNGNGVIQIAASDIEVRFAPDAVLRGAPAGRLPDAYEGYGIRLNGRANVTIRNARISGFRAALWATDADGLTVDSVDASDNRRVRLKSTPAAEDASDWLFPHNNDANEWLTNYAAAFYIEDSNDITVKNCRVRHGQNALCLDRVNDSKICDNDFSFNSGWGIALWRSNRNAITRNACDFCIRGYSHGVYNRGQDSAGILMFEQNSDNLIAENSATHSGDGFFGFAGREALGETATHSVATPADKHRRCGNNRNLLIANDFSYAAAHGIEMTFSFANVFYANRLVENAICGVWAGYSQDTLIARNDLRGNGEMAYGLERGGINIEHGRGNRILENQFRANKCAVHLWWDPEGDLAQTPWARANGTASTDNLVAANRFTQDALALHFRGPSDVALAANTFDEVGQQLDKDPEATIHELSAADIPRVERPSYTVHGTTRPVGARVHLRGRHNIIMTEWGPWDHEAPLVRLVADEGDSVRYDLHKLPPDARVSLDGAAVTGEWSKPADASDPSVYTVQAARPGVHPYVLHLVAGDWNQDLPGTLIAATWDVTFFPWTPDVDPREKLQPWRDLARTASAVRASLNRLRFPYGYAGPSELSLSEPVTAAKLGGDHFGMIATTELPLTAGAWQFQTLSDDGVRVTVDGKPLIDNWTWHGPTRNTATLELPQDQTVRITVEHFEIDGYATLQLTLTPP